MATIPSQETKAVADLVTAAWANSDVRDSVNFILSNKPLGFYVQQTAQTGWSSAAFTAVTFTGSTEMLDRDTQHDNVSNTSRVVIGETLGWYRVSGVYVAAQNSACTLVRACIAYSSAGGASTEVNGSATSMSPVSTGSTLAIPTASIYVEATNAADYVELRGWMTAASGTRGTEVGSIISSSLITEYVGKS
jgi:hypothetical protein